jgi:twinkle protein
MEQEQVSAPVVHGEHKAIPERGINLVTSIKYNVKTDNGKHYYPYYNESGELIAYKERTVATKEFRYLGKSKGATLFGQNLFHSGGKYVTILEGECFHPDTEVFTRQGWVTLKEWDGQEVMTGAGVFEMPLAKVEKPFEGSLVSYSSGSFKALLTPNHNMVRISPKDGSWVKRPANADVRHMSVPRVVNFDSNADDLDARLQVMLSADFTFRKEGDIYGALKKQRKVDRATALLDAKGVRYSKNLDCRGYTSFFIHRGHGLNVSKLFSYERDLNSAKTIIEEMVLWDGNKVNNRNQVEFSSKELHNATFIQACAHLCGYVSTIMRRSNQFGSWYKVSVLYGKQSSGTQQGYTEVPYEGLVNCLTVPSGTLMVRWKESVSISGNCDALAAYQMTGSQWSVVSIRNGAKGALKDCKEQYEWLNSFENVVICFDGDAPGREAAKEVAELFGQKAKIFQHLDGHKDACDYLKAGDTKEFINGWWRAKPYVPDGIVNAADLWEDVVTPEKPAEAFYPFKGLNKLLYGLRPAELITVTAGSGLGKSQFLREILVHILKTTEWKVGGMFLEESVRKTARSIMSIHANKMLHLPDTPVTDEELREAFNGTIGSGRVYLFDHFGSSDVDNIANRIRYMAKALDCKVVFLDHLSIIVSGQDLGGDERKAIDNMMTKLRTLVQELEITLICVSHLRRPQGNAGHEDGGSVSLSQLRGSGAIAQLSDAVITLERNSMAENEEERHTTKVAVAKNRFNGFSGPACLLKFDKHTGRMIEIEEEVL